MIPYVYIYTVALISNGNWARTIAVTQTGANVIILCLQEIGINSQGTVNAILFCLLTKQIRMRWYFTIKQLCKCQNKDREDREKLLDEATSPSPSVTPTSNSIDDSFSSDTTFDNTEIV